MSRRPREPEIPPCYAMVHPGLERIAAEEIKRDLGGEVKKSGQGIVAFRLPELGPDILKLRTVEDVFLFGWGTEELTHRLVAEATEAWNLVSEPADGLAE